MTIVEGWEMVVNVSNIWLGFWLGNNQAFAPFTALAIV